MSEALRILGLIPARGGSKRVARKNLAPLAGRPLITYTIESAQRVVRLTRTIVSTEDAEIAGVAKQAGCEVPFLRPIELAQDDTPTVDVVVDALRRIEAVEGQVYDAVCILEPTAPLRSSEDITAALVLWEKEGTDSLIGLMPAPFEHPSRFRVVRERRAYLWAPELWHARGRHADGEAVYVPGGGLFAVRRDVVIGRRSLQGESQAAYLFPPERGLDINTPLDLFLAEQLLKVNGEPQNIR